MKVKMTMKKKPVRLESERRAAEVCSPPPMVPATLLYTIENNTEPSKMDTI